MVWCDHCLEDSPTDRNPSTGYICCMSCGKVIDQDIYADEPTFVKAADGSSRLSGTTLSSVMSSQSLSRLRTIEKGKGEILSIMTQLQMGGEGSDLHTQAGSFYEFALSKQFTRGRVVSHVAAVCLYLSCRVKELPYLLIDFSEPLQANVYVLGAVFLQLCKLLRLEDHHTIRRLVDPSLFIHRFTRRLLGRQNNAVSETALRIIASMKRDWMQTGRKPSGLCGAALYISALSHGFNYSKSDIVTIVHICEATLTKRLIEFENTESGCLTVEEFVARADKLEEEAYSNQLSRPGEVLCQHKTSGEPHFAHGLCRGCYDDFIKISGGLEGGAEPPAFQRAERQRTNNAKEESMGEAGHVTELCDEQHHSAHNMGEPSISVDHTSDTVYDSSASKGPKVSREAPESIGHHTVDSPTGTEPQVMTDTSFGEEENLSDIDDDEVDGYLHNEEEKRFKEIIWTAMNKEYLEEQAAKEAAAAVASNDASLKPKKERKRRRTEDAPPETAAEAAYSALGRKGHSSKINYNALGSIFPYWGVFAALGRSLGCLEVAGGCSGGRDSPEKKGVKSQETENNHKTVSDLGVETDGKEKNEATKYNDVDYGGNDYDDSYGNGEENFANNEEFDFEF